MKKLLSVLILTVLLVGINSTAYAGRRHHRGGHGNGGYLVGGLLAGAVIGAAIANQPRYVPVVVGGIPYYTYNGGYYQYVNGGYVVVQQPVIIQQPVQQVVQSPLQPIEETVKCPVCGQPYKIFHNLSGDQSACPVCVAKATENMKK